MSTLFIRLPSKAAAEAAEHWLALPCPFALASPADVVEREGIAPLSELAGAVASAQRVVLVLAASDVTLLRVKTPPLSAARLRLVLPNLVEDQLMADPDECVVVPGNLADGLRTAAVVQRGWLDILSKAFTGFGARTLVAVPAQLCLPYREGSVTAAIAEQGVDIDLTLRLSEQDGVGLPIMPESSDDAAQEVRAALRALAPAMPITLYVPHNHVIGYRQAYANDFADDAQAGESGITVFADNWCALDRRRRPRVFELAVRLGGRQRAASQLAAMAMGDCADRRRFNDQRAGLEHRLVEHEARGRHPAHRDGPDL